MNIEHPSFQQPEDINASVWRYLNFTKLVHMLSTAKLPLIRVDCLDDPQEGSLPAPEYYLRELQLNKFLEETKTKNLSPEKFLADQARINRSDRTNTYVNSWHLNSSESPYMWKIYGNIAIKTTYKNLCESIKNQHDNVFIGKIKYIDYNHELTGPWNNTLDKFMHKHKRYPDENEIRVLKWVPSYFHYGPNSTGGSGPDLERMQTSNPKCEYLDINLDKIIQEIYVDGYEPSWFHETVENIVKVYLPNTKVLYSAFKSHVYF